MLNVVLTEREICKKIFCKLGNMPKKKAKSYILLKKNKEKTQKALQFLDFVICKIFQKVV